MNKKYLWMFIVSGILAVLLYYIGTAEYASNYLVEARGMCPTGCSGIICTQGFYNCYTVADKYITWLSYLLGIIAILNLGLGFRKKSI